MTWFQSTTHLLTGGAEKVLRIFDLGRPDAPPTLLESSPETPIRAAVWHHSDQTILSSSNDIGGVRYATLTLHCTWIFS
jgi:serine-threonine kinase receptor-associated protein